MSSAWPESVLVGGPQDGAKIAHVGNRVPPAVYVGPKWLGDGYAAWWVEQCERFPECYVYVSNHRYEHRGRNPGA